MMTKPKGTLEYGKVTSYVQTLSDNIHIQAQIIWRNSILHTTINQTRLPNRTNKFLPHMWQNCYNLLYVGSV